MDKPIAFVLIIVSALIMGTAEGRILTMNKVYPLWPTVSIILLYLVGMTAYLVGLMKTPEEFVKFIAIWEFIAILTAIAQPLLAKATRWDSAASFYAVMFMLGIAVMIYFGEKLLGKFGI